jgi:hypothetical protein
MRYRLHKELGRKQWQSKLVYYWVRPYRPHGSAGDCEQGLLGKDVDVVAEGGT